ncbi:MAG: hypothetical protein LUE14_01070, partial [Clostridiales bacterium]|nr:hypothetical protein [Clostridiales bacterium]
LMSNETWLDAKEAFKLGFCDEILFTAEENPEEEEEEEEKPDDPDGDKADEDDENEGDDEKKGIHLYSTRLMNHMIMNHLGVTDEAQHAKLQEEWPSVEIEPPKETALPQPVIGMDGTTEDGSVPYQILEKQLEFLR